MKTNLVVTDPLAGQEVSILMTVAAGEELPREKRPFLISVGVAGQMPISRGGAFGDVAALIHEAWTAFGVQVEMNEKTAVLQETTTSAQLSTGAAEELIAETIVITDGDASSSIPATKPTISKLSLF